MKKFAFILIQTAFVVCFHQAAAAQQAASAIKTISFPAPKFPAEVADIVYGTKVSVSVAVDKQGKVSRAVVSYSMAPCSDLNGETVRAIRSAALEAAKNTMFEPFVEDGNRVEKILKLSYDLKPPLEAAKPPSDRKLVNGGVINGKARSLARPFYSAAAKAGRIGGSVGVQVLVGESGKVLSAGAVSGHPELYAGSLDAACRSEFAPTLLEGKPVKVSGVITYNFVP